MQLEQDGTPYSELFPAEPADTLDFANTFIPNPPSYTPRNLREVIPSGKGRLSTEEYLARVRRGQTFGIPSLLNLYNSEHSGDWRKPSVVCIVGGGPSLQDEVGALRKMIDRGAKVIAVNKSHDWLLKRGLRCDYAALLDPKDWVAGYIDLDLAKSKVTRAKAGKNWVEPKYLIASQCHGDTLNKFKGHPRAYMWHAAAGLGELEILNKEFPGQPWVNIAGASVIGLRAAGLAYGLGFREKHFFGIDGSMKQPKRPEMRQIFKALVDAGIIRWDEPNELKDATVWKVILLLTSKGSALPSAISNILKGLHYSYPKPHIDATWKSFCVGLKSGWESVFLANHHMARTAYEFEDSMRHWDKAIMNEEMEPFTIKVHGNPEYSAIAMIAAGMGIHADAEMNGRYGRPPQASAA